jgi:uncharacterized protein (TIGR00661 family)
MVDVLRRDHRVVVLAAGDAHPVLARAFAGNGVRVEAIPGLRFRYNRRGHLAPLATALAATLYVRRFPQLLARARELLSEERADLAITDFEPSLARAARSTGVPFISLDHQHFLVVNDLSNLPGWLRGHVRLMAMVVRCYYSGQAHTVVSSFYSPPLKNGVRDVTQVGVLLRQQLLAATATRQGYLVAYLRRRAPSHVIDCLAGCGREVRIYGLGERPPSGMLRFRPISEQGFISDLAGCEALVSTAGNQLIGEALYLGKPVLALPEAGNYEQYINAHFIAGSGCGRWRDINRLTPQHLLRFLAELETHRSRINRRSMAGNAAALAVVQRHLAGGDGSSYNHGRRSRTPAGKLLQPVLAPSSSPR